MNFQSFGFLAFLLITVTVCLAAARWDRSIAAECLTLACLVFYVAGGGWAALLVLVLGLAVSVAAVRYLTKPDISGGGRRARRLCLSPATRPAAPLPVPGGGLARGGLDRL